MRERSLVGVSIRPLASMPIPRRACFPIPTPSILWATGTCIFLTYSCIACRRSVMLWISEILMAMSKWGIVTTVCTALLVIAHAHESTSFQVPLPIAACLHRSGKDGQQFLGTWYEPISGMYTSPSFFAPADMRVVRRSNFLLGNAYGEQTVGTLDNSMALLGCCKHSLLSWSICRCPQLSAVDQHDSIQIW